MTKKQLINTIIAKHRPFGTLCYEAYTSNENGNYMAALSCLFVLTELVLKDKLEIDPEDRLGLYKVIEKAKSDGIISYAERLKLHEIREVRNALFHDDHYENILEIGGLLWPIYEDETKEQLFNFYSDFVFKLAARLVVDD